MFAMTLNFYSPRAYQYVRAKFGNNLPHRATIRKWYANSNVSGDAGFCAQSLKIVTEAAKVLKASGTEPMCALLMDEMSIRKHLQWDSSQKSFLGQITYGFRPEFTECPVANNALVYMLNGINFKMTIPISHYFIKSLKAVEKAVLLTKVINEVSKSGVRVMSVTFDGLSSNFTMCNRLGANLDVNILKPYFVLPGNERKIFVIVDPSHVLKLARNTIGNNGILSDGAGHKIEWQYFKELEDLRIQKDFSHVHKLTKKHIEYGNFKMNVRIAAETLSNSVAAAMELLEHKGYDQFQNSSATVQFVRFINKAFDIMNTKCMNNENRFKSAINLTNKEETFAFLDELVSYLKKIKLPSGQFVIDSLTKTAFRGLIINAVNFKSLYVECVESNVLECLPTFLFSQDHLESFFGRIRSLPGCNDNPTVQQFRSAFKQIVVCDEIKCSDKSNCKDNLNLSILSVSCRKAKEDARTTEFDYPDAENPNELEQYERLNLIQSNYKSNDLVKISVAFIASIIEDKIRKSASFDCGDCYDLLSDNDKIDETFQSECKTPPCQSTFEICYTTHKYVQNLASDAGYTYKNAKEDILIEFDENTAYPKTNFSGHETHKEFFINFIIEEYIQIQATYIAKRVTLNEQKIMWRHRTRKFCHFSGV